ncbi:MAG: ribbon-helix-helix protein, CopG family [Opitutales bacterium]
MKAITVNVSEPTYREFQEYARRKDRKTSELIREAMELYREQNIQDSGARSLRDLRPQSLGKVLRPLDAEDDLLDEMVHL